MWCEAPSAAEVATLLSGLFGRPTTVKEVPVTPRPLGGPVTVFVRPDKTPAAIAVSDFPFAATVGAVLTMLPPATAKDAATRKDISGTLAENLAEVLNVVSSRLTRTPNRVIMRLPFTVATLVPDDAKAIHAKPGRRVDYDVDVAGYGGGKIAFFLS